MKKNLGRWLPLTAILFVMSGCASPQRPVLYDNAKLNKVGREAAESDIDACFARAGEAGVETQAGKRAVKQTAGAAAVGAAAGGAAGAFSRSESAGSGAAAGAAGAAAGTAVRATMNRNQLDPTERRYVEECLREKGYKVVGWN
jgi:hypothetical protein